MTSITRILVPTDFSTTSDHALEYARRLAESFGASLHLAHAFEDPYTTAAFAAELYTPLPIFMRDQGVLDAEARLSERLPQEDRRRFRGTAEVVTGSPARAIGGYAAALGADLIVMGTHGRGGMAHLLLGSVAEQVVRTSPCAVLTIREPAAGPVQRILVPTDFSETADAALGDARLLAARLGAALRLLHVVDDPFLAEGLAAEAYIAEAPAMRTALLEDAKGRLAHRVAWCQSPGADAEGTRVPASAEVLFGRGAKTIAEYAAQRGTDLIVMGTHGRSGLAHLLLGSVAERLIRTAPCPVLTVRQRRAPVTGAPLVYDLAHLPA